MAITWNNIAAPNFSAANELFKQAKDNLLNVGTTLTATAQGYQDAIRKRNTGLIQEYINSARTPEELQSEAFQVGYQNLVNTLAKEYDPVAMNQYKDSRGDVLTKRANDTLNYTQAKTKIEQDDNFNKALIAQAAGNLYGDALTKAMANIGAGNAYNLLKLRNDQDQQTTQNELAVRAAKLAEDKLNFDKEESTQKRLNEKPITDLYSFIATQQLNEFKQDNPQITSPTYRTTVNTFGKNADANKNSELGQKVYAAADRHGVDKELMFTLASIESNWDHGAKSNKGAVGLMQLMPEYNKERGVKDATNIDDNINGGAVYLKQLGSIFGNDTRKIVAAYNAGQGGVQKAVSQAEQHGGRWEDYLPDETKQYLQRYTDLSSYLKTGNTGRDLNYPSGLKTDTYSGGGSSSSSSSGGSNSTKPDYVNTMLSDLAAVDKTIATEQLKTDLNPDASKGLVAWENNLQGFFNSNVDDRNILAALEAREDIKKLPQNQQVAIVQNALTSINNKNLFGNNLFNFRGNRQQAVDALNAEADKYTQRLNARINAEKKPIYLTGIRAHSAKTGQPMYEAARDLLQGDELTIYRLGIESPVVNKAKLLFAQDNKGLSEDAYVSSYLEQYSKNPSKQPVIENKTPVEPTGVAAATYNQPVRGQRETNRDNESAYQKMLDAGLKVEPSNSVTTGASITTQKAEDNNLQRQEQRMQEAAKQRLLDASKQQVSTKQEAVKPVNRVSTGADAITERVIDSNLQAQEQRMQEAAKQRLLDASRSVTTLEGNNKPIIDAMLNPIKQLSTLEQMLKIQEQMRTTKDPILLAYLKQQMLLLLQQKPKEEDKGLFGLYK